jgi:glutamyl-tRNA reductase
MKLDVSTGAPTDTGKGELPLAIVACDFRVAPPALRERLVTTTGERKELAAAMQRMDDGAGFMALETCNRVEWIVASDEPAWMAELLRAQMLSRWCDAVGEDAELPEVNVFLGTSAATHLFRLVAGMESLAAGEAEIAGQFQKALQRGMTEGTTCRVLNGLGRFAGGMAKTASRVGFRSGHSRGIHVLAGLFIKKRFRKQLDEVRVGVAGLGEIGRKTALFIEQSLGCRVIRFNRTIDERHLGKWMPLELLPERVGELDVLVVATGAMKPVIDGASLPGVVVLDLGIPRQVAFEPAGPSGVEYYDVDSLVEVAGDAQEPDKVAQVQEEVTAQVGRFRSFCLEREVVSVLRRAQARRYEMLGSELVTFVEDRFGDSLDSQARARVVAAMKELVRHYSSDVFDSVHEALDERWRRE